MYVYVWMCMYVCMYIMDVCMYVWMCMYVCMYIRIIPLFSLSIKSTAPFILFLAELNQVPHIPATPNMIITEITESMYVCMYVCVCMFVCMYVVLY